MNDLEPLPGQQALTPQLDPNAEIFRTMVIEGARIVADGSVRQEQERTLQQREETERLKLEIARDDKAGGRQHQLALGGLAFFALVTAAAAFQQRWELVQSALALAAGFLGGLGYGKAKQE